MKNFSVLVTVYNKENPAYLEESLDSIIKQTLVPSEIVVVKDGRLTPELDRVLEEFLKKYPNLFSVLSFDDSIGRGEALRRGVDQSRFEVVAIMDSDDISKNSRFEKQMSYLEDNSGVDIVGSFIEEFSGSKDNITSVRIVPTNYDDIVRFAKWRNPMNHVTIMFKKDAVLRAGSYHNLAVYEDYYMIVRAIKSGCKLANIPESLVRVRAGNDMIKRRGGLKYFFNELKALKSFLDIGFLSYRDFFSNIIFKGVARSVPSFLRKNIYRVLLRSAPNTENQMARSGYDTIKRIFDLLVAYVGIFLLGLPMLFIAVMIKIVSKGPVIFWTGRIGINNKIFRMAKFRTMKLNTPQVATHLMDNPKDYLIPAGGLLRKYSLDELPQLFNVIKGDMSFVGPRPALFNQDDLVELRTKKNIHALLPGVTGWAQVNGRDDLPIPVKVSFDEY